MSASRHREGSQRAAKGAAPRYEVQVGETLRWYEGVFRPGERQQRPCGDAGTGGGADVSSSDAAEEKMEQTAGFGRLARVVNRTVQMLRPKPLNGGNMPAGKLVSII